MMIMMNNYKAKNVLENLEFQSSGKIQIFINWATH